MNPTFLRNGFILAALMNFSVIVFSRGFTNEVINQADPVVMSNFGLLMIVIWGLAYLSAATLGAKVKWLALVFTLEKLIYGVVWVQWHLGNSLGEVFSNDFFAGVFFAIYGLNDFVFMAFFGWVFISLHRMPSNPNSD